MATEIRQDLRDAEFKNPGYILDKVMPRFTRSQIAGNFYYQKFQNDISAQRGRNLASPGNINRTHMASSAFTFTCTETRARIGMGYTELKGYKDKLHAELAMARRGKRAYFRDIEAAGVAALLGCKSAENLASSTALAGDIEALGLELLDKGPGKLKLAVPTCLLPILKADSTVKDRMKNTGVIAGDGGSARTVTLTQLAQIFNVDDVLEAPTDAWYADQVTAGYAGCALLFLEADANIEPAEEVQLGRTIYFDYGEGADIFQVESWHDDDKDEDMVDVKGLVQVALLNKELCVPVRLAAAPSSASAPSGAAAPSSASAPSGAAAPSNASNVG